MRRFLHFAVTTPLLFSRVFSQERHANLSLYETSAMAKAEVVYQFEKGTWVENLAVRSNGNLVVTLVDRPEVWEINPSVNPATGHRIHRFPDAVQINGITETKPDHFVVAIGGDPFLGTIMKKWTVAEINMAADPPAVRIVIEDVASARLLNGIARLNESTVLIADTLKGSVWQVDVDTGLYKAVNYPTVGLGVNGIRTQGGSVWTSNTLKGGFGKLSIDMQTGAFSGTGETFSSDLKLPDDFAVSPDGSTLYACNHWENGLTKVDVSSKKREIIAGGPTSGIMLGPTSVVYGRTNGLENTLYVSTAGKSFLPMFKTLPDSTPEGGRIVKVTQ
jgi:hypothetical protein